MQVLKARIMGKVIILDKLQQLAKLKSCRWPMYIVIALCYMFTPFHRMAPAIMGPELIKDLSLGAVDFGLVGMTFMWAFALAQAPCGNLLDRVGPRRGVALVLILTAIGSFIFSYAHSLTMLLTGRVVIAIALGGFLIGGAKIISKWYTTSEYPLMWGMFMALGTLGGVGATKPLQFMMANYGWRNSFIIIAGVSIALALLVYFILKDRPSDVGLATPDELAGEVVAAPAETARVDWKRAVKQLVSMPKLWLSALMVMGVTASGQVLTALWGGVFLADVYNLPRPVIGDILFVSAIGLVIGCAAAGWLMKQIKISGVLVSGTVIFLITWLYMTINVRTLNVLELKVIMFLIGLVHMYVIACNFTLIKVLVPSELLGTGMGLVNTCSFIFGAGVFQQLWGYIINTVSKGVKPYPVEAFQVAMWVQVVFLAISAVCALYFAKTLKQSASGSVGVSK